MPATPRIRWGRCEERDQRKLGLQCGTALVPLDYGNPKGPKIVLDLARKRATSGRRTGTVFVNPGGPGGTPTTRMDRFLTVLGRDVTRTFDVVAMDPRGVGQSSRASCWSRKPEPDLGFVAPGTAKEIRTHIRHDDFERAACAATGRPIIDHMSTGDVARDMDLMRRAVGDRRLTYYGVSYGTVQAATYAAMFPGNVRAMVLDGVVDPRDWTTGKGRSYQRVPVSVRTGSGPGADETLRAAFAACRAAGPKRCPNGATVAAEWDALLARLARGPVTRGAETLSRGDFVGSALNALYDPDMYPTLMAGIHKDYQAVVAGRGEVRERSVAPPSFGGIVSPKPMPDDVKWWDTFTQVGVMCSDSLNPRDPQAWPTYAKASEARSWFTGVWTWNSSLCAGWPGRSTGAYRGPFDVKPATPLLVVGNTHDPATPLSNAQAVARMSPGARLVTVDAFGHTIGDGSRCASAVMRRYLATGVAPSRDVTCRADKPLF